MITGEEQGFWTELQALVDHSQIVIDRPKGSAHPRYPERIYQFDYGYLKETVGGDGEGIDCWCADDYRHLTGMLITADPLKRDVEAKLLLGCSPAQVKTILSWYESLPLPTVWMRRTDSVLEPKPSAPASNLNDLMARVRVVSQGYADRNGINRDLDWYALKLTEELGELVGALLQAEGRSRQTTSAEECQTALEDELADVLGHTLLLADQLGIDPEEALARKWFRWLKPS
ncbi:MAG: hypothetical protein LBE83_08975 [Propionibacteriaceae bacterium]|jgi:inorganic pyrophosphatase|nr:hypothetical protein [Propionibacteriaceae bacterium]